MSDKYRSLEDIIRDMMLGRKPSETITTTDSDQYQSITVSDKQSSDPARTPHNRTRRAEYKKKIIDAT